MVEQTRLPDGFPRWSPWHSRLGASARAVVGPLVLAGLALAVSLGMSRWAPGAHSLGALGAALLLAAFIALVPRKRWPFAAYGASTLATVAYLGTGHSPGPIFLAPFWGLLNVIAATAWWRLWLPAGVLGGVALATVHGFEGGSAVEASIFFGVWIVLSAGLGLVMSVRRRFVAEVAARAQWAQRSRAEEEGRRLAEERLRIAREVHDVVGHSLAVISLQAGVAEHLLESRPQEVRRAVAAIRRVSRQALGELRVELAALRDGSMAEGTAPTPGLGDLASLVSGMRDAGLAIDLVLGAELLSLPAVVGTAAYRIVQEALTNVARHAGAGAAVTVSLSRRGRSLEIEVVDRAPDADTVVPIAEGHGISGMRERVAALGGRFEIDRRNDGVRVLAQLPIDAP